MNYRTRAQYSVPAEGKSLCGASCLLAPSLAEAARVNNSRHKVSGALAHYFFKCHLFHLPLLNAGRPVLLHRDFKAQRRRRYGFEGDLIKAILLDAVSFGGLDRLPCLAVFIE